MGATTTTSFSKTFNSDYKRQKTVARGRNQVKGGSERETELLHTEEDPYEDINSARNRESLMKQSLPPGSERGQQGNRQVKTRVWGRASSQCKSDNWYAKVHKKQGDRDSI